MVVKTLTKLGRIKGEHTKNFNKDRKNITMYQTEVTELKNTVNCTKKHTKRIQHQTR